MLCQISDSAVGTSLESTRHQHYSIVKKCAPTTIFSAIPEQLLHYSQRHISSWLIITNPQNNACDCVSFIPSVAHFDCWGNYVERVGRVTGEVSGEVLTHARSSWAEREEWCDPNRSGGTDRIRPRENVELVSDWMDLRKRDEFVPTRKGTGKRWHCAPMLRE